VRTLVAQNFHATPSDTDASFLETGHRVGDVRASMTGYRVSKVSIFASAGVGMAVPDESKSGVSDTFGWLSSGRNAFDGRQSFSVWPRMDASNNEDFQGQQKVLLSEWGDTKFAFVLDGAYTKTSAVEELMSEVHTGMTYSLLMGLLLSIFSTLWGGCGGIFVAHFWKGSGGDGECLPMVCAALWTLVLAVSIGNLFVILISFIVRGSFVPLACVWSVPACLCCGGIFAVGSVESGRCTNSVADEETSLTNQTELCCMS